MKFRRYRSSGEKQRIVEHVTRFEPDKGAFFTSRMNREVFYPLDALGMEFVSPSEASHMRNGDYVMGIEHNGEAKAYPAFILDFYHHTNDVVGGEPIVYST